VGTLLLSGVRMLWLRIFRTVFGKGGGAFGVVKRRMGYDRQQVQVSSEKASALESAKACHCSCLHSN
jgi:hypothetical protein